MRRALAFAAVGATLLFSGCQTGKRATLQPLTPVKDPNAAPIVDDLSAARSGTFTAEYRIKPTSAGESVKAKVVNDGGVYEVTIGETGFTTDGTTAQTCTVSSCEAGFNDSYISNLNVTHVFWATSFEQRLRTDSERNIGTTTATTKTIAGVQVRCVTIPLVGGSVEYCTVPGGPLASYLGADVSIELTAYTPGAVVPSPPAGTTPPGNASANAPTTPANIVPANTAPANTVPTTTVPANPIPTNPVQPGTP